MKPATDDKPDKENSKKGEEEKKQGPDLNAIPPGCAISKRFGEDC